MTSTLISLTGSGAGVFESVGWQAPGDGYIVGVELAVSQIITAGDNLILGVFPIVPVGNTLAQLTNVECLAILDAAQSFTATSSNTSGWSIFVPTNHLMARGSFVFVCCNFSTQNARARVILQFEACRRGRLRKGTL